MRALGMPGAGQVATTTTVVATTTVVGYGCCVNLGVMLRMQRRSTIATSGAHEVAGILCCVRSFTALL